MSEYLAVFGAASMIDQIFTWYPDFLKEYIRDAVVVTPERSELLDQVGLSKGFHNIKIPRKPNLVQDIFALFALFFFMYKNRFKFVHSYMPKAGFITALSVFMLRSLGSQIVYVHTFTGLSWSGQRGLKLWLLSKFDLWITYVADYILVESVGVASELVGLNKNCKPTIIGCGNIAGVNLAYFKPDPSFEKIRKERELKLVYVGRVSVEKGIFDILSIFHEKYDFVIHLDIVGTLELGAEDLKKFNHILSIHPEINYVGFQLDVRPYIQKADYLVLGSHREGFANVILQSLALGVPVISSKVNGIQDILSKLDQGEEIGFFFEVRNIDALKRLIPEAYNAMGTIKYSIMQKTSITTISQYYSSQVAYDGLKSFYRQLGVIQ
ncbi:MAG: glycosyltransferase [Gammaproteobacteria bacterium]|nr:glycosyltransferase [Gammaproteobacteria bacterium]